MTQPISSVNVPPATTPSDEKSAPKAASILESKVRESCQRLVLPIGIFLGSEITPIEKTIKKWNEKGAIDITELAKIKEDAETISSLSKLLDRQTALFAPNTRIEDQAIQNRSNREVSGAFWIYEVMLIYALQISRRNREKRKVELVLLSHKDVDTIENNYFKVKKMLLAEKKRIVSNKNRNWPTNKVLFGAALVYLSSPKDEEEGFIPTTINLEKFISRCLYVYRHKFEIINNMNYVTFQALSAAIYFLYEFHHLHKDELNEIDHKLRNLYLGRVTSNQFNSVYKDFSVYYKTDGLMELRLEELLSEWTQTKDRHYQFKESNNFDKDFPFLGPDPLLFFKSNAFLGIFFESLNDETEKTKFKSKCLENILNELLKVYLDFSCLDTFLLAFSDSSFPRENTITIGELQEYSLEDISSIEISRVEKAYFEALVKVILNISSQINIRDDVREKIDSRLANCGNVVELGTVDILLNHSLCQVGIFSKRHKELKVCADLLEFQSLLMEPNYAVEAKAFALLEKKEKSFLSYSEEIKILSRRVSLYNVIKALISTSQRSHHIQHARKMPSLDDSMIFRKSLHLFQQINNMFSDLGVSLPMGQALKKLSLGAFLVFLESENGDVFKALDKEVNLEDFLDFCEDIYLSGNNQDLNKLSYIHMQTMSASIYFLCQSNRLDRNSLSSLEKFLGESIICEYTSKKLRENLSSYKVLYPFFKDEGKALLLQLKTIVSFLEGKDGEEEFFEDYSLMFVHIEKILQSLYSTLNNGKSKNILNLRVLKSKLSRLLKLYIESFNANKFLELEEGASPLKISAEALSDYELTKINLKDIEHSYSFDVLVVLVQLSKYIKLDDETNKKLLELFIKVNILIDNAKKKLLSSLLDLDETIVADLYVRLDDAEKELLDKATKSTEL